MLRRKCLKRRRRRGARASHSTSTSEWTPHEGPQLDSPRLARALDAFRDAGFVLAKADKSGDGLRCSVSLSAKEFRAAVARGDRGTVVAILEGAFRLREAVTHLAVLRFAQRNDGLLRELVANWQAFKTRTAARFERP